MKSTNISIIIVVLILIAGTVYALSNKKIDDSMMNKDEKGQVMEKESMMKKDDAMMKASSSELSMMTDKKMTVKAGVYEGYSPEKIMNASSGKVVLFFKANWCPSCKTARNFLGWLRLVPLRC